jgi:hypothetical protein
MAKLVRFMWGPVLLSVLYLGWVFWQRHTPAPGKLAGVERNPLEACGDGVKILHFYAGSPAIAPGEKALVCYSVINATAVRLDPSVEKMWPALSRCFEVTPAHSTRYTLTAEGADHTTVSESIEIEVKR